MICQMITRIGERQLASIEELRSKQDMQVPVGYCEVGMKGSIGQKSQICEVHPDAGRCSCMRSDWPALKRIEAHLGTYKFIETCFAGRMWAD